MADRPLEDQERAAIAAWLEAHRPTVCPRTGTGDPLPFLGMTMADHIRLQFTLARSKGASAAKARAA